jgi:arogenate dehydrogenase (NADP+)
MSNKISIAVIGLGLIGGSILKSLRLQDFHLIAISGREETISKAQKLDLADEYSLNIESAKNADMVIICTPIHTITGIIDKLADIVAPNSIITDVASVKGCITDYANNFSKPIKFIGGHPMAGTEYKGVENSFKELFQDAKWVLTPSKWINDGDIEILKSVINCLGAKIIIADPQEHDKAVALISHLPLFISQTLFNTVDEYPDKNIRHLALSLASSGFRDTTRLAATNPELSKDMLLLNKQNLLDSSKIFEEAIKSMKNKLDLDEKTFFEFISELALDRAKLYSSDGKNTYE